MSTLYGFVSCHQCLRKYGPYPGFQQSFNYAKYLFCHLTALFLSVQVKTEEGVVQAIKTALGPKKDCLCFIEVIVHKDDTRKEFLNSGFKISATNNRRPNPQQGGFEKKSKWKYLLQLMSRIPLFVWSSCGIIRSNHPIYMNLILLRSEVEVCLSTEAHSIRLVSGAHVASLVSNFARAVCEPISRIRIKQKILLLMATVRRLPVTSSM